MADDDNDVVAAIGLIKWLVFRDMSCIACDGLDETVATDVARGMDLNREDAALIEDDIVWTTGVVTRWMQIDVDG